MTQSMAITPRELHRVIRQMIPSGATIDAMQAIMLTPDAIDVKIRITDGAWMTGVVTRAEWEKK